VKKHPFKTYIILLDLAGLELGASYYRHRARLGVGQKNGAELAPGVVVSDGVVMTPSRSLAIETYILTIAATVEAAKAVEDAGGELKRQPNIMLGEAHFLTLADDDAPVDWSSLVELTAADTRRHDELCGVLTASGRPPKKADYLIRCMDCGADEVVNVSRPIQCANCGALDVKVEAAAMAEAVPV
jgi:hypothetical protein